MRRTSRIVSLVTILLVAMVLLAVALAGCGDGGSTAAQSDGSPAGILSSAVAASQEIDSAKGTFDLSIEFDVDASTLPEEAQAFVGEPIRISGTLAAASEPLAGDVTVSASIAGASLEIGLKMLEDKAWIGFMDQWYEAPAEMMAGLSDPAASEAASAEIFQIFATAGIDPATWFSDLKIAGEESVDGVDSHHLTGSPDVAKMMTDLMKLMESGALNDVMGGMTGGTSGSDGAAGMMPSAEELQEMQTMMGSMFQDLKLDIWVGKDDSMMRKAVLGARMVPPAGEDTGGINAITLSMTMTLRDINEPVTVEAPASAKPSSELEKAMEDNLGSLLGPIFGGMGMGGAIPTDIVQ